MLVSCIIGYPKNTTPSAVMTMNLNGQYISCAAIFNIEIATEVYLVTGINNQRINYSRDEYISEHFSE